MSDDDVRVIAMRKDGYEGRLVFIRGVLYLSDKNAAGVARRRQITSPAEMPGWASDEEVSEALEMLQNPSQTYPSPPEST